MFIFTEQIPYVVSEHNKDEKHNDVIDFLMESYLESTNKINPATGKMEQVVEANPKIAWFQGHNINRPFGNYAKILERWENLATECYSNMSPEPAAELAKDIMLKLNEHKRGIDGKSSETYRDKNNNQASIIQILANRKRDITYTVKGDGKKSFLDGLLGKNTDDEPDK